MAFESGRVDTREILLHRALKDIGCIPECRIVSLNTSLNPVHDVCRLGREIVQWLMRMNTLCGGSVNGSGWREGYNLGGFWRTGGKCWCGNPHDILRRHQITVGRRTDGDPWRR